MHNTTRQLTTAQRLQVCNLQHALWKMQEAQQYIQAALGCSDVAAEYRIHIAELVKELEIDIEDVRLNIPS